jgi:PCI domain
VQDRDPLHLCTTVAPHLASLENKVVTLSSAAPVLSIDHGQHLSQLKSVAVLKMLRQLSSVYSVMRIEKLSSLIPFMSFPEVEAVLADAIKFGYVHVQIDHRMGTLHFGGATLRNDGMASHLSAVAGRLAGAMHLIKPEEFMERQDARAAATAQRARDTDTDVNKNMLARKVLIERRKEEHERAREEAEKEEEQKKRAEQVRLARRRTRARCGCAQSVRGVLRCGAALMLAWCPAGCARGGGEPAARGGGAQARGGAADARVRRARGGGGPQDHAGEGHHSEGRRDARQARTDAARV